jgi:hypothetical protein
MSLLGAMDLRSRRLQTAAIQVAEAAERVRICEQVFAEICARRDAVAADSREAVMLALELDDAHDALCTARVDLARLQANAAYLAESLLP